MAQVTVQNCCALAWLSCKPGRWKGEAQQLWGCCSFCCRTEFPSCLYSRENAKILHSFLHPVFTTSLLPDTSCARQMFMMKLRAWIQVFKDVYSDLWRVKSCSAFESTHRLYVPKFLSESLHGKEIFTVQFPTLLSLFNSNFTPVSKLFLFQLTA